MEIHKLLVLSTGHLPHNEFKKLGDANSFDVGFSTMSHEYGTIVNLHDAENECVTKRTVEFPKLTKIIEYAEANGIKYINFDQDGNIEKEFEKFDW